MVPLNRAGHRHFSASLFTEMSDPEIGCTTRSISHSGWWVGVGGKVGVAGIEEDSRLHYFSLGFTAKTRRQKTKQNKKLKWVNIEGFTQSSCFLHSEWFHIIFLIITLQPSKHYDFHDQHLQHHLCHHRCLLLHHHHCKSTVRWWG